MNPRFLYSSLLPSRRFPSLKGAKHTCRRRTLVSGFEPPRPFKLHIPLKMENSLSVSAEPIVLAGRLIGVGANLFQVADIIRLTPGITGRLKLLYSAKADQPLLTTYISFSWSVLRTSGEHK